MKVRNPDELATYLQAKSKAKGAKKFKTRSITIYGATPDRVMEIVERALNEASRQEPAIRRSTALTV